MGIDVIQDAGSIPAAPLQLNKAELLSRRGRLCSFFYVTT